MKSLLVSHNGIMAMSTRTRILIEVDSATSVPYESSGPTDDHGIGGARIMHKTDRTMCGLEGVRYHCGNDGSSDTWWTPRRHVEAKPIPGEILVFTSVHGMYSY